MDAPDDLICFSRLPWDGALEGPQELLSAAAKDRRVFFVEELCLAREKPQIDVEFDDSGVIVLRPFLPADTDRRVLHSLMRELLTTFMRFASIERYVVMTDDQLAAAA